MDVNFYDKFSYGYKTYGEYSYVYTKKIFYFTLTAKTQ